MSYSIKQLADLAGISVRTLHYYDQIGLLNPSRVKENSYRYYEDADLIVLQQILFFRELEFSLDDIKKIILSPDFDVAMALNDQKKLIKLKRDRLEMLLTTIDKTIKKINHKKIMADKDLYGGFSKEEMEKYAQEAKERWGHTDTYRQSQIRVKKMGKAGLQKVLEESGRITQAIASEMKSKSDPASDKVQSLIAQHYNGLRAFYEPNLEMYRGLAQMYVDDPRFKATYEKIAPGLAEFMRKAMIVYCDK